MLFALGYNLLLGTTGLPSFGHGAFFGVGAYAFGLLQQRVWRQPLVRPRRRGAGHRGAGRALVARFISHRRGIYYALLTIAFGQVFWFVAIKWHSVTGGEDGLLNIKRLPVPTSASPASTCAATRRCSTSASACSRVVAASRCWRLVHSPFGRVLRGDQAERDARRASSATTSGSTSGSRFTLSPRPSPAWPARCSRWRSSRPTRT